MKQKTWCGLVGFAAGLLLTFGPVRASEEVAIPTIEATETEALLDARGDLVHVEGVVLRASAIESGMNFLNFSTDVGSGFVAVVFPADVPAFGDSIPSETFNGRRVRITGEIGIYKEQPQIVLRSPDQIEMIE